MLLTVQQVSTETGFSAQKIHRLIASGNLKAIDTNPSGRKPRWSIRRDDLNAFLTPQNTQPAAPAKPRRRLDAGVAKIV